MRYLYALTAPTIKFILITVIFYSLFLFIGVNQVFAVNYTITFENSPPGSLSACTNPSGCENIGTCWNSWAPGQTDCGQACIVDGVARGDAWSKYTYSGCYETRRDPLTGQSESCTSWYNRVSDVCSTADKCDTGTGANPNQPYLQAGKCDCTLGGIYKACCTNTSPSTLSTNSCVQVTNDPYNPLFEGVCPAGSSPVFCGFGSYPPCDSPTVCGPVPTPAPTPTPPPTLNSFSGVCVSANYTATLSWSGTPLPSSDPSCPNGFWADIDDNSAFSSYSNKCVTGTSVTTNGSDFGGPGGSFTFLNGVTYYGRVYNGSHSNTLSLTASSCAVPPTVDLKVNGSDGPITISNNSLATLDWTTQNFPTTCPASGSWSGSKSTTGGSETTALLPGPNTLTYTIVCSTTAVSSPPDSVTVNVSAPSPICDYDFSCSNVSVAQGQSGSSTVNATLSSGTSQTVNFSVISGLPSGAAASTASCNPNCSAPINITTSSTTPAGTYTLTVRGQCAGSADKTRTCSLTVTSTNQCLLDCAACPSTITCGQSTYSGFCTNATACNAPGATATTTFTCSSNVNPACQGIYPCGSCAPAPPPGTCQLFIEGNGTTSPLNFLISDQPKSGSGNPVTPTTLTVNGIPETSFLWTCASVDGTWTCLARSTAQYYSAGTVVDASFQDGEGNSCQRSYTVGTPPPPSCGSVSSSFTISAYTFADDVFNSNQWPQICYTDYNSLSGQRLICGSYTLYSQLPSQQSTLAQAPLKPTLAEGQARADQGSVLAGESCRSNAECPKSSNLCVSYTSCNGYRAAGCGVYGCYPEILGTCKDNYSSYGNTCGTSSLGGNLYCNGTYSSSTNTYTGNGICSDSICKSNADCGDTNACTQDICLNYQAAGCDGAGCWPEALGKCGVNIYGIACGTSANGGNMYCGGTWNTPFGTNTGNGICYDTLCKTNAECNDGNVCTTDSCSGYLAAYTECTDLSCVSYPEKLGSCQNANQPSWTVCQTDSSGSPQKLCSQATSPAVSTCSVDYVKCTDVKADNQYCCGLTNRQTIQPVLDSYGNPVGYCARAPFPVNWNYDSDHPFNNPLDNPTTALPLVTIHAQSSDCPEYSFTRVTDVSGYAYFSNIPRTIGSGVNTRRVDWDVWADIPLAKTFTRGTRFYLAGNYQSAPLLYSPLGPGGTPKFSGVSSGGKDARVNFGFQGPPTYKVSGRVLQDVNFDACLSSSTGYQPASLSLNPGSLSTPADGSGNYTFSKINGGSYTLSLSGFVGNVVNQRINGIWNFVSANSATFTLPPNTTVDFCVNTVSPWIQTFGGDVHSNINISTPGGP